MPASFVIPSIFKAVNEMSPTVQKMRGDIISFGNSAEAAIAKTERFVRRLTPGLKDVHKQILSMVGAGALLAGSLQLGNFSFRSFKDYETSVDAFRVIVSDLNDEEFTPFQKKIDQVANDLKRSGAEVAAAFEQVAGKNAKFAETADGLGEVSKATITLAKAARMDLGGAAENLVGIMNQFSLAANQANRTINVLAAGQAVGAANITQTAEAFVNLGPTAASANVTLEQSVALIQTLAKFSLYGADAGTALRGSIIKLQKAGLGYRNGQFDINDALDHTNELLAKLHTAKAKDALITKIFGIHNITAGKILVANRDTFHEFTNAVTGTSEAQKGAAINSGNLSTTLDQLSASWVNMLTTSTKVGSVMNDVSNAAKWLSANLESVVSKVITGVKVYASYKAVMLSAKASMFAWNVTLGISTALQGASSVAMRGNTVALSAQRIALMLTRKSLVATTATTQGATAATEALNATLVSNPAGAILLGVTALAAGIGYLAYRQGELNEEMEKQLNMDVTTHIAAQAEATKKLAKQWEQVGYNTHDAIVKALQYQVLQSGQHVNELEQKQKDTERKLLEETDNAFFPAFNSEVQRLRDELSDIKKQKLLASSDKLGSTNAVIAAKQSGIISDNEALNILRGRGDNGTVVSGSTLKQEFNTAKTDQDKRTDTKTFDAATQSNIDKVTEILKATMAATITIKNESDSEVSLNNGKTKVIDVQPKTSSTKVLTPAYGR